MDDSTTLACLLTGLGYADFALCVTRRRLDDEAEGPAAGDRPGGG